MEKLSKDLNSTIESLKYKIECIANCDNIAIDAIKYVKYYIRQFDELNIPVQDLLKKDLIVYMKSIGQRFSTFKSEADGVVRKWQRQIENFTRSQYIKNAHKRKLEQLLTDSKKLIDEKPVQPLSPHLNGSWKAKQGDSDSDYQQNYHSSSSQELESPDSQKQPQINSSFNCRSSNLQSFHQNSSSPFQTENTGSQNVSSAEFNANLSIDTTEITPINRTPESPLKPFDRFSVPLKENMFKAIKLRKPPLQENLDRLLYICDSLKLPKRQYPRYLREYQESQKSIDQTLKENKDSSNCSKSLNGKTDKKIASHQSPSSSQQGSKESSRNHPESKHDKKRKRTESPQPLVKVKEEQQPSPFGKSKHRETSQSAGKAKELKEEQQLAHVRKLNYRETTQSVSKVKELKEEQQPCHDAKLKHRESTLSVVKEKEQKFVHEGKSRHKETSHSASKAKELKVEDQPTHDGKLKHKEAAKAKELKKEQQYSDEGKLKRISSTQLVKDQELNSESQSAQVRASKYRESLQTNSKFKELRVQLQPIPDSKLDIKRLSAMAPEPRNCDKNHIKIKDSPDQSAMIAITSSKKERTSIYHGGKKCEMSKLKDICMRVILKGLKQTSDPTKYINKDVSFESLEPILVQLSPEKLHKLEEEKKYLLASTDQVWKLNCDKKFKSLVHLRRKNEPWRTFYERCCMESKEKLKNLTASINASASKGKPDRQIKFTTVEGPPTKRQKTDHTNMVKCNGNISAAKALLNSAHPSNSRSVTPVPPKGTPNHTKPAHRTIKKDAPLMHKAKKTLGQLNRIHRN